MSATVHHVPAAVLKSFMADALSAAGVPAADAEFCSDVLIAADLRGIDSHGISRLKPIYVDRIRDGVVNPVTDVEFVRRGPTSAVIDAHDGLGMVASREAMNYLITQARQFGMAMAVIRNSSHYGIAGYYPLMAVEQGLIGISGTNARPSIAPTFGVENMLGTNPLTFAMPTDEAFPFLLDCATSVSQRGKIEVYDRIGKPLPPGWVIDPQGNTMTDAHEVLEALVRGQAALTPLGGIGEELGGYKGYGYATVVEILCAALQQGAFLQALYGRSRDGGKQPYHLGHFFIVIDPQAFCGLEEFRHTAGEILRALRNSAKAPGCRRIYTAGEKEYLTMTERSQTGIPINASLQQDIIALKHLYRLERYHFDFE